MSATLQERQERAESRIEALLFGMDETVRQVYESLLERGTDYRELTPEKKVARLEGFHDYIITRDATGVDHPSLADYLEAKKKFGDEMLSFGTGKHRDEVIVEAETVEPAEEEVVVVDAPAEESPETETLSNDSDKNELPSFLAEDESDGDNVVSPEADEDSNDDDEPAVTAEPEAVVEAPNTTVWDDDDDDVVIDPVVSDENEAKAPDTQSFDEVINENDESEEDAKDEAPKVDQITERIIIDQDFATKLGGYTIDDVDDYLDPLAEFFKSEHSAEEYAAKASEVKNKTFGKKSFKKGFASVEVDAFLDRVSADLEMRAKAK